MPTGPGRRAAQRAGSPICWPMLCTRPKLTWPSLRCERWKARAPAHFHEHTTMVHGCRPTPHEAIINPPTPPTLLPSPPPPVCFALPNYVPALTDEPKHPCVSRGTPPARVHPPGGAVPSGGTTLPGPPIRRHHRRAAAEGPYPVPPRPEGPEQPPPSGPRAGTRDPGPRLPPPGSWPACEGHLPVRPVSHRRPAPPGGQGPTPGS